MLTNTFSACCGNKQNVSIVVNFLLSLKFKKLTVNSNRVDAIFNCDTIKEQIETLFDKIPYKENLHFQLLIEDEENHKLDYYKCDKNGWYKVIMTIL